MSKSIKTLLLYANGTMRRYIAIDTVLRGALHFNPEQRLPASWLRNSNINRWFGNRFLIQSYIDDWIEAFRECPDLDVDICNICNLLEYRHYQQRITDYDLIIISHGATGDDMRWLHRTAEVFKRRRGKMVAFIGNEYNLMPEKIAFLRDTQADYVATQLPYDAARWLYNDCKSTQILLAPHALNPKVYNPPSQSHSRSIDIGFIGVMYPYFIGDTERKQIVEFFRQYGSTAGLVTDIRFDKIPRQDWASFLKSCRGIVGAEAGTYYLERDDHTINAILAYQYERPQATFEEIFDKFFKNYPSPVSGKALSSRHFEPIGTQTCQILIEGHFNNILLADQHYIAVKKDFSNIEDVIERFNDETYRTAMTQRTYEYVMDEHTYVHRVKSIVQQIFATRADRVLA